MTGNVTITSKNSFDAILYGSNISLKAVVGNNGTGKSTLLFAIQDCLLQDPESEVMDGFVVYKDDKRFVVHGSQQFTNIKINGETSPKPTKAIKGNIIHYSDLDTPLYTMNYQDECLYESPFFKFTDISSSSLLYSCNRQTSVKLSNTDTINNFMLRYYNYDVQSQIELIRDLKGIQLPFDLPSIMNFTVDFINPSDLLSPLLDTKELGAYNRDGDPDGYGIYTESITILFCFELKDVYTRLITGRWGKCNENYAFVLLAHWNTLLRCLAYLLLKRKNQNPIEHDYTEISY